MHACNSFRASDAVPFNQQLETKNRFTLLKTHGLFIENESLLASVAVKALLPELIFSKLTGEVVTLGAGGSKKRVHVLTPFLQLSIVIMLERSIKVNTPLLTNRELGANKISMNLPIPPSDVVLPEVSPLIPIIYDALEAAVLTGREFFADTIHPFDPWYYCDTVRYHAKLRLDDVVGIEVEYERDNLANSGLSIRFKHYHIRILKAEDGRLPSPGISRSKQGFYRQEQFLLAFMLKGNWDAGIINLVVVWNVSANGNLLPLLLSCPRNGTHKRKSAEDYWTIILPHPAETVATAMAASFVKSPIQQDAEDQDDDNVGFALSEEPDVKKHGSDK